MIFITETDDVIRSVASFSQLMREAKPGEYVMVKSKNTYFLAKRAGHWYNNNFGCATRVVKHKYFEIWEVECQKSKKQPFAG